jgi:hypothetical protein
MDELTRTPPQAEAELLPGFLDQYKLAVEMADRVSARRGAANSFFLTVNTALTALLGGTDLRWYVPVAGIAFAGTWSALLRSYSDLNRAKFAVILQMEERLPVRLYGDEWSILKPTATPAPSRLSRYRELGQVERLVPGLFALMYLFELIRQV